MSKNDVKKHLNRHKTVKRETEIDNVMDRGASTIYRESLDGITSDSGESSLQNSVCNDMDYETSYENLPRDACGNSRDEIAEKLSKLNIGCERNFRPDSGIVQDLKSERDLKSHSFIAGRSPADGSYQQSIHSIPDSWCSVILADRLDSKDRIDVVSDEHSLLNIAINESVETNGNESLRYVDSLEVEGEERTDSLETRDTRGKDNLAPKAWSNNVENVDPNLSGNSVRCRPRIISNEMVNFPLKSLRRPLTKLSATADSDECVFPDSLSDRNDNVRDKYSNLSESTENRFDSLISTSERFVIADLKTPNSKQILFIEDCCKSSPKVGVNADTFGSEFFTDISNLSMLGNVNGEENVNNRNANYSRDQIFKRFSQQFAEAPTKFTEKLLNLFDESVLLHSRHENHNVSDVSLSRLTEEFRKICRDYGKRIEDESMPDFGFGPSFYESALGNESKNETHGLEYSNHIFGGLNAASDEAALTALQNFSKLGGGKKVYRKTPRRVFKTNGTHCSTLNCANVLHRGRKNNLESPNHKSPGLDYDSTATFEFWENLCYEMSPTKQAKSKPLHIESSGDTVHEDLIRKSDQQMASLDESIEKNMERDKKAKRETDDRNLSTASKECQDHSNSMREEFIQNLSSFMANGNNESNKIVGVLNQKRDYYEVENILTARLVEKRRKCFEEARKVFETKQSVAKTKNSKCFDKILRSIDQSEDNERFLNTLSACVDYFDHAKTLHNHKTSLHCIMECSENSESVKETTNDSRSIEFVEAMILPIQNRAKHAIEKSETRKLGSDHNEVKQIAQTSIYLSGTPGTCSGKSPLNRPKRNLHLSPIRRRSPGNPTSTVLAKKIKSPVSPVRKTNVRPVKPASHFHVPRSPSVTPRATKEKSLTVRSGTKSNPRLVSNNKMKSAANSPGLTDVTNIKKSFEIPKVVVTNPSPSYDSQKKFHRLKLIDENMEVNCQRELNYSDNDTPEMKTKKFFFTPGKTPTYGRVKPKKKYFESPKETILQKKLPTISPSVPGSHRINYNTVQSPVGMYIRGTDPNLITNVKGKTNERMLTPCAKTPNSRSKVVSPILARSPRLSPTSTESSRLKFQLTPSRRRKQEQASDILNIALCESDPSSNIGSESTSHSPFPKIFYKPAPCVKMVNDNPPQKRHPKVSVRGTEEKIIYRHEGRFKAATESMVPNFQADRSAKDSLSCDSGDISLLHQRLATKTNYLFKK